VPALDVLERSNWNNGGHTHSRLLRVTGLANLNRDYFHDRFKSESKSYCSNHSSLYILDTFLHIKLFNTSSCTVWNCSSINSLFYVRQHYVLNIWNSKYCQSELCKSSCNCIHITNMVLTGKFKIPTDFTGSGTYTGRHF